MICLTCRVRTPRHRSGRCPLHRRQVERAREANPARRAHKAQRYDSAFKALRRQWAQLLQDETVPCARCGEQITDAKFDLDHLPDGSLAPSHPNCNRGARANPKEN